MSAPPFPAAATPEERAFAVKVAQWLEAHKDDRLGVYRNAPTDGAFAVVDALQTLTLDAYRATVTVERKRQKATRPDECGHGGPGRVCGDCAW